MSEAEAVEAAAVWSANILTILTIYVTFTFGYLVTAYFVGARLTPFQTLVVSGLYLSAAVLTILSAIGYTQAQVKILGSVPTVLDDVYLVTSGELWITYLGIMMPLGLVISLYFMWQIRHPKKK